MRYIKYISFAICLGLFLILVVPMLAGIIETTFGDAGLVNTGQAYLEPANFFQIALLATALGGVMLWFAPRITTGPGSGRVIRGAGKILLFSACCFVIIGLLSPVIPEIRESTQWWDIAIRYIAAISFIAGSIGLIFSVCAGVTFIWEL
jgi:hypothetical protein